MLSILVDSAIAIGLLVGVTVLSVCVFGAIAYAVASRKHEEPHAVKFLSRNLIS